MDNIFNKSHFESNDGMLTSVWGPSLWHVLHIISFNYPVKPTAADKQNYHNFLMSLQHVLPCKYCRDNFATNLQHAGYSKHVLRSRHTFSKFLYKLHEEVNSMLNKSSSLTFNQVKTRYEHFRSRCLSKKPKDRVENGCIDSLYGRKSKCILKVVPKNSKLKSFNMSTKCKIKRLYKKV